MPAGMASRPLVSIVMPLYNKRQYVGEAIESVLRQSHADFELLIVNDGSTDDSRAIACGFDDPRIRVIDQANLGVSLARNRGVDESAGELVAFIDADDVWYERHVEALVEASRRFPSAGMFANAFSTSAGRRSVAFCPTFNMCSNYPCSQLDGGPAVWTSAALLRRDVLRATGGFPVGESHGEDLVVWLRASLLAPVVFSDYVGAYYRQTPDGLATRLIEAPDALMREIDRLLEDPDLATATAACLRELGANIALAHAITAYGHARKDIALRFVDHARATIRFRRKASVLRRAGILPAFLLACGVKLYAALRRISRPSP